MSYYLGIDGGGTATRAVILDDAGRLMGLGIGGPANPKSVGLHTASQSVLEAVRRAWKTAGLEPITFKRAFYGVAGLRTIYDQQAFRDVIDEMDEVRAEAFDVSHDLRIALAAGYGSRPGIVLVSGTGSACYGCNAAQEEARAGGWGWFIDDPGSGYWLGFQAMRAAARAVDGRGEETCLTESVQRFLRLRDIHELPNIIYNPMFSRERIAELAPILEADARKGDAVALAIFEEGADELVLMVDAVARKLGMAKQALSVVAVGGLMSPARLLFERVQLRFQSWAYPVLFKQTSMEPCLAAALLAYEVHEEGLSKEAVKALRLSYREFMEQT